jgi:hypothetical protein
VALNEGRLTDTTVTDENELVLSNNLSLSFHSYKSMVSYLRQYRIHWLNAVRAEITKL